MPALRDGVGCLALTQASLTPPGSFSLGYYVNSPSGLYVDAFVGKSIFHTARRAVYIIAQAEAPRRGKRSLGKRQTTHPVPEGRHKPIPLACVFALNFLESLFNFQMFLPPLYLSPPSPCVLCDLCGRKKICGRKKLRGLMLETAPEEPPSCR